MSAIPLARSDAFAAPAAGGLALLVAGPDERAETEARLVLDAVSRHLDALLVCGDNRIDAFGLLARARREGLEDAVADGLFVARAFTVHQLAALVEETLPLLARERHPGVVLVTGLLDLFLEEDVRDDEARRLLARCVRSLSEWGAASGLRVVATASESDDPRARALLDVARAGAALGLQPPARVAEPARRRPIEAWTEA